MSAGGGNDVMLTEFIPDCPRLHHGVMVLDNPKQCTGDEWVCRLCGTRLYATDLGPALPQVRGPAHAGPAAPRPRAAALRRGPDGRRPQMLRAHFSSCVVLR